MKIALTALASTALAACGAPTVTPHGPEHDLDVPLATKSTSSEQSETPFTRLDPMLDLTIDEDDWKDDKMSWVHPARASLEVGGSPIDSGLANAPPVPTTILDRRGNSVRLAVRLDHAKFSLWTDRGALLAIAKHDLQLVQVFSRPGEREVFARLHAGAYAERVEKRPKETKIRFLGEVEMEGWVPDDAIADTGGAQHGWRGRIPSGLKQITALPGSEIFAEPRWGSTRLAAVNSGYWLDEVDKLDDDWLFVTWQTGIAEVAGYYRQYSAPGRTHSQRIDPDAAPAPIVPNMHVASGTCLYARANGESIGFLVGDQDVQVDPTSDADWPTLAIDTPWGAILFRAHGHDATDFATCVPANATVPQSVLNVPPPTP
ncbi:MAG TPA: hypothetical protein VGM90_25805 [Kofleriaceae bacterium]